MKQSYIHGRVSSRSPIKTLRSLLTALLSSSTGNSLPNDSEKRENSRIYTAENMAILTVVPTITQQSSDTTSAIIELSSRRGRKAIHSTPPRHSTNCGHMGITQSENLAMSRRRTSPHTSTKKSPGSKPKGTTGSWSTKKRGRSHSDEDLNT